MWLLIVVTTLFNHQGSYDPSIYTFQKFHTQARCQAVANFVNKHDTQAAAKEGDSRDVSATCIFNGKEEE